MSISDYTIHVLVELSNTVYCSSTIEWRSLAGCLQEMFPCYLLQVRNKTFLTKTKTKHKHLSCQNFFIEIQKKSCQNVQSAEI